jgi:hypothetical protein
LTRLPSYFSSHICPIPVCTAPEGLRIRVFLCHGTKCRVQGFNVRVFKPLCLVNKYSTSNHAA